MRLNVDTNARIIDYDIRELGNSHAAGNAGDTGRHLQPGDPQLEKRQNNVDFFAMSFMFYSAMSTAPTSSTSCEMHPGKYNGLVTGLTQNVDELLRSDYRPPDAGQLGIPGAAQPERHRPGGTGQAAEHLGHAAGVHHQRARRLRPHPLRAGSIVPFTNSFPKNTRLYQLMTTKPDEALR